MHPKKNPRTTHTVSELSSACLSPVILLKQVASLLLITLIPFLHVSPVINPPLRPSSLCISCLFSVPLGSLHLFRQDLSSSVKLQSAYHSAGCLERLTMTYQTLQTIN